MPKVFCLVKLAARGRLKKVTIFGPAHVQINFLNFFHSIIYAGWNTIWKPLTWGLFCMVKLLCSVWHFWVIAKNVFFGFLDLAVSVAELFWISQCGWIPLLLCYLLYVYFDFMLSKMGSWGAKQKLYEKKRKIANSATELRWAPGPIPKWSPPIGGMIMVYDFGHLHLKGDPTVSFSRRPSVKKMRFDINSLINRDKRQANLDLQTILNPVAAKMGARLAKISSQPWKWFPAWVAWEVWILWAPASLPTH